MNPKRPASMSTARWALAFSSLVSPLVAQSPESISATGSAPRLNTIRRLCVEKFVGEESLVAAVREIAIASVFALKRFTVTERCDKSDAVLKGAVIESGDRRVRGEGDSVDFGVA